MTKRSYRVVEDDEVQRLGRKLFLLTRSAQGLTGWFCERCGVEHQIGGVRFTVKGDGSAIDVVCKVTGSIMGQVGVS